MRLRSLLFVPGDRPERIAKALGSEADALILDLEDAVAASAKPAARQSVAAALAAPRTKPLLVRVNPLASAEIDADLAALTDVAPDALVLPKAEGAASVTALVAKRALAVLPVATETPFALFQLGSYREVARHLVGLTWGAEDLPAAIGSVSRTDDGRYTQPFEVVRSLALFGAHAAGVPAIETIYPDFRDDVGLAAYAARGRRDGFTGMMAIHPAQLATINAAFTPDEAEIAHARAIVALFAANPGAGALSLAGRMVDAPHLKAAERLLARL